MNDKIIEIYHKKPNLIENVEINFNLRESIELLKSCGYKEAGYGVLFAY